jgi:Siphovirus Gp157
VVVDNVIANEYSVHAGGNRITVSVFLMKMQLQTEAQRYQLVREGIVHEFPGLDDETIRDTLEGITDLHEMIAAVIRSALVDEALHSGLRFRVDDMRERLSRLELRASKKRQLALEAMSEVGLSKLEQPDFTASVRAGSPALVVVAEESIPEPYWLPQPPKLDRQAILGELKRGISVAGAEMSNPKPVLSVRTK